jgi:hypothetical protein
MMEKPNVPGTGGDGAPARAPDQHRVALLVRGAHGRVEAGPVGVAARHADVAGGRRDRDRGGTLASGDRVEDGAPVGVGHPRVLEPFGRQQDPPQIPVRRVARTNPWGFPGAAAIEFSSAADRSESRCLLVESHHRRQEDEVSDNAPEP